MTAGNTKTDVPADDDVRGHAARSVPMQNDLADAELDQVCGGVRRQSGRLYYRDSEPAMQGHGVVSGRGILSSSGTSES